MNANPRHRRLARWEVAALLVLMGWAMGASCTGPSPSANNPLYRTKLWQDYRKAPQFRALAIAGDPDRKWVGAASAGASSIEAARGEALAACGARRKEYRMQAACAVYAEGDTVVWTRW